MTLSDKRALLADDLAALREYAKTLGLKTAIDEVKRTMEQQALYIKAGRSKTTNSMHLKGLAVDLVVYGPKGYVGLLPADEAWWTMKPLGLFWESLRPENRWGGNFDKDWGRKDPWIDTPHFEQRG